MPIKAPGPFSFCIFFVLFFGAFQPAEKKYADKPEGANLQFSFNYAVTKLLHPPYVSGVMNDPADPASTAGITVDIKENDLPIPAGDYSLAATSDNAQVVAADKIIFSKSDGQANVKIFPSGTGYANITLTLTRNKNTATLEIFYAASADPDNLKDTYWHTAMSDASAAIALDSNYMVVADDEINGLFVYHRYQSGLPVTFFSYNNLLQLPDEGKEIDCEACARSLRNPERVYWTGSMSNGGKNFKEEPNRSCLFATDISGTGGATKFSFKGAYMNLRRQLIKWGDANGYKFSSAAGYGETPKQPGGFNVEGAVFAPDSNTLYIAFRAPIVPVSNRMNAVIAPIENFETWFNNGKPLHDPVIGTPIELDLGARGIRDIIHLNNGNYIIVAGSSDEKLNEALYTWTGKNTDKPVLLNVNVQSLKSEAAIEIDNNAVQLLSDNGSTEFYNDGIAAKHLFTNFKKFHSNIVSVK